MLFDVGDYMVGAIIGAATAAMVRLVVWPGMDMVIAMVIGMGLGMLVHLIFGFLAGPLIGMFNAMIPASIIGMYGGMFFGMRDSMAAGSRTLGAALAVGVLFGALVVGAMRYYDRALRGTVMESGD